MAKVLKSTEFDVSKLDFEPIQGKKKNKTYIQFATYEGDRCPLIQFPFIHLECYGVPSKNDFYKEEYQRQFIKLPLNQANSEVKSLTDFLGKIDKRFGEKKMCEKLLGKKIAYNYQPLVKYPKDTDGEVDEDKLPYVKIKLASDYETGNIITAVFKQIDKHTRELVSGTSNIDGFYEAVKFLSCVKCIVSVCKLWNNDANTMYGISLKLVKVLVDPPPVKPLTVFIKDASAFVDSESDED